MNRSTLILAIARRFPQLATKDAELCVAEILWAMTATMNQGGRVEIRGFGTFACRLHAARIGRNPKTGEAVAIREKRRPHFKAGKELRGRLESSSLPLLHLKRTSNANLFEAGPNSFDGSPLPSATSTHRTSN